MRAALRRAFGTVRAICEYVIESCEVETSGMRASALRARGVVLAIELSELKRMECGSAESGWPSHRFADAEMFREYLLGEVGRINARWIASHKQAIANELEIVEGGESAYVALGCDPAVAEVLAWGWSVAPQAMRRPWRIIASLLGVVCSRQDVTAVELPPTRRASPWKSNGAAAPTSRPDQRRATAAGTPSRVGSHRSKGSRGPRPSRSGKRPSASDSAAPASTASSGPSGRANAGSLSSAPTPTSSAGATHGGRGRGGASTARGAYRRLQAPLHPWFLFSGALATGTQFHRTARQASLPRSSVSRLAMPARSHRVLPPRRAGRVAEGRRRRRRVVCLRQEEAAA